MYVVNLNDLDRCNIGIAGGKGVNLGKLLKNKFNVPDGFVITTNLYENFLIRNGIYISEDEKYYYKKINKCIKKGSFSNEMIEEIKNAYEKITKSKSVAVRSSATAEDLSDASFAGQLESYLNVEGLENLLQRIKDCFASCFTDKAVEYRKKSGYGFSEVKVAVVVQEMINSDISGVLFTANVLNKNKKEMIVDASYGLGEGIVSGRINPDEYILGRGADVIKKYLGKKEKMVVYNKTEVCEADVDEERRSKWVLDSKDLKNLYSIAKNIEKLFKIPQDIEWALKDGEFYILQSRSVTTLKNNLKEKHIVYNYKNISEIEKKRLAFTLEHIPYSYYPLDFQVAFSVESQKDKVLNKIGLDIGGEFKMNDKGMVSISKLKASYSKNIIRFKQNKDFFCNIDNNKNMGVHILKECKEMINYIEKIPLENKSLKECGRLFNHLSVVEEKIGYARFRYFLYPSFEIEKKIQKYIKRESNITKADLLRELNSRVWQESYDLNKLKEEVNNNCDISEKVDEFLKKHGHKSNYNCYPFSSISWNEDRDGFINMLKNSKDIIKSGESFDKSEVTYSYILEGIRKKSGQHEEDVIKVIEYWRMCYIYSEEARYLWEECQEILRRVLRRVSEVLKIDIKDLWFLMFSELLEICRDQHISNYYVKKINMRKRYREEAENSWCALNDLISYSGKEKNILKGIAGSNGIKRGKAFVLLREEDYYKINKGDILVCNSIFISLELTKLLSIVSAVVLDTGGALSHVAIIAREYGIPIVIGTGDGTKKIHTGDEICVDGYKGRVMIS